MKELIYSKRKFRRSRYWGILRDYNGNAQSRSSKSIGCLDPTGAELAVIMEAIEVFKSSRWVKIYKLMIESDSLLSVSWIENSRTAPSNFAEIVSKCATLCTRCSWEVRFVFRERNVDAHSLAQAGVGRHILLLWFAPVG
ncbi:hypothetical protein V6N13_027264 [Hibiscus sabdariffa]